MKNLLPLKPMLLVCAFFLLISQASYAQKTWDGGAGTSNWGDASNWNNNTLPISSDAVTLTGGQSVVVNVADAVCASLSLSPTSNSTATLSFNANSKLVVSGTVSLGNSGNNNRRGSLVMTNGGTLVCNGFALNNSGSNIFTRGSGTVILTATNTLPSTIFTSFNNLKDSIGTTTLSANLTVGGSLSVSKGATLALSTFTLGSPTSLSLEDGAVTGSRITGSGVLTLGGNITVTSAATGNDGAIISCPVALGATRTITVADDGTSATDLTMTGIISGSFGITKNGEGELHVSGANTYTGTTTVSVGKLKLGASSSSSASGPLGTTGSGTTVSSGAVLDLNGFSLTSSATEALTLNGTGISSGGALTNSSSTASNYIGLITIASSTSIITNAGDINLTNTGTFTSDSYFLTLGGTGNGQISGVFSANTNGITKIGAGTWTLSGTNTYAGPTLISAGTLKLGSTSALGSATGSVTVASGGALDLNGFSLSAVKITSISGTGVNSLGAITNSSTTPATYSGAITLAANSSIVGETGSIAISNTGQLVGSGFTLTLGGTKGGSFSSILNTGFGGLTKIGSGTWTINAENFYNGITTISEGTLKLGIGGLLNTADRGPLGSNVAGTTVASGAVLDLNGFSINNTSIPEALTLNGSGISSGGALTNTGGAATYKGAITLASASTITATTSGTLTCSGTVGIGAFGLTLGGAGTGTMSGIISTPTSLTKDGAGTWTLSGTNTYTGTTTVSAGTLVLDNSSALGANTNSFVISTGAKADIKSNETVGTMTLGGMGTANGTWGFTGSGATYIDATYFTNSTTGKITVSNDSRDTPVVTPTVGTYTYNGSAQGPNAATNTGTGTSYTFSYAGTGGTTYTASATAPTNAGTYTVTVTVAANANYQAASSIATAFTIDQANLTITANNQTNCAGTTFTFAGTEFTTSGLVGGNTVTSATLSSTGSASSATAGTYDIVPTNAAGTGLANYTISYENGTLTVNALPSAPTGTSAARCGTGTVSLSASGTGTIKWYNASTGGTLLSSGNSYTTASISATTIYYAMDSIVATGCISATRTAVTATVNAVPSAPTGTDEARCGSGTVVLSASGTGTIKWYSASTGGTLLSTGNSYTTPSISSTTIYYALDSNNAPSCVSATRTAVTATVNAVPSAPTGTSAAICGAGTVDLSATGTGTIKWYTASTGGTLLSSGNSYTTPSISTTTIYYALDSIVATGCTSTRTAVTATINTVPSAPTGTSAARCGTGTVGLSASGTGTIKWYNASTGGTLLGSGSSYTTPSISTTTIYYAMDSIVASGCISATRTAVTATVNAVPSVPTGTDGVRCGTGTVSLTASGTGTIKWYSASTGGTLLSAGNSYTTPSISSTTIYYAMDSIVATGCVSATRTAVTATVNAVPSAPTGTSAARCGTGTVSLSASGTGTIKWYNASTAGTLLSSGNSYTTPSISSTTIYYALDSIVATGCTSTRTAVTATVKSNVGITSATAASSSICSSATTTLTANGVEGTNAVVTWWTATGGTGTNLGTGTTLANRAPGTYFARVTGDCGTAVEASVTVSSKVNVGITSATAASSPICPSATTTLTANGVVGTNAVVTWWTATGGTGTNLGTGTTTTRGPGTYFARVTGDCGTAVEASVTVSSLVSAGITSATAASSSVCTGSTTTLTANGAVGTNAVVTWWTGTGGTGTNLGTGTTLSNQGPGTYFARVTADCGSAVERSVTVASVASPTGVIATASSNTICGSGTVNLTGTASGASPTTIAFEGFESSSTYSASGGSTKTGTSGSGDRPASTSFVSGGTESYWVNNGTATITTANFTGLSGYSAKTVSMKLAAFSIGSSGGLDVGDFVTVAISLNGGTTYSNELTINGNNNAYWAFSATGVATVVYDGNNSPTAFAPSSGGSRTSDGYSTLNIAIPDAATQVRIRVTMENSSGSEAWVLDDIALTGTQMAYSWTSDPAGFTSSLKDPTNVSVTQTTTYTLTATNAAGCSATDTAIVRVNTNVGITSATAESSPICSSATITLTANGVTGTNAVVTWWTATGGTGTNLGTGTTISRGPGTYFARVTGDCGTAVERSVTVASLVNAGITSATAGLSSVCSDATTTLTANGAVGTNAVVTWWTGTGGTGTNLGTGTTLSNQGQGTYYARVTADCGSAVEASVTVTTKINVGITSATAASSSICSSATTTLTANGVVGTNAVVTWWTATGGTGTNLGTGTTISRGPGTYFARVTGDCGTAVEASVTVSSKVNVGITSATAASSPICPSATTTLTANGVVGTNAVVTWWTGTGGTGTNLGTGITISRSPGTYFARVTGDCGAAVQASVTVSALANAGITSATAASASICASATTTLTANGVTGLNPVVTWWTGTGGTGTNLGTGTTLSNQGAGTYFASVTADCGTAEASVTVATSATPSVVVGTPSSSDICEGSSQILNASATISSTAIDTVDFNDFVTTYYTTAGSASNGGNKFAIQNSPYNPNSNTYIITNNVNGSSDGTSFMVATAANLNGSTTTTSQLISTVYNTQGYTDLKLVFNHSYVRNSGTGTSTVEVSTDGGTSWTTVKSYSTNQGANNNFVKDSIVLNAYINQSNLRIRFNANISASFAVSWWAIDKVLLKGNFPMTPLFSWSANTASGVNGLTANAQTYLAANSTITVSPTDTTLYTLTAKDPLTGCTTSGTPITVNVLSNPEAPIGTGASRCSTGRVMLMATVGVDETVDWYTVSSGGTPTATGTDVWQTPSISTTTTYYIATRNTTTGCESATRTPVVATINDVDTTNTTVTNCVSYFWNGTTYTNSGTFTYNTTSAAGCDSTAILNLTITVPTESSVDITNCDSYTWNGTTYITNGTYTFTTTNSVGCDSIATLNLTINRSTSNIDNVTNCDTYTWNGTTYSNSGTYSFSTTNSVGCDSTAILNLTINRSSTSSPVSITVCDEFTWNENTYTASGVYTYSTTNSVGCDSTATLNLTVKKSTTSTTVVEACDAYRWNNATYSASGIFTYTTTNSVGCDSVASLDLTIKYSTSFEFSASNCDNYLWNGVTYSASGTYSFTTTNAVGCDSVATLNLTILESTTSATTESACEQYEWNGVTYSNSGTYTYLSTNASGCSSTDTLHITIKRGTTSSTDEISCETFAWNGSVYSNTGTFTYNTTNSVGCDSVALLNLTILNGTNETIYAESCVNYFINDSLYTESGTYTQRLVNSVGCDSVLTIILTINQGTFTSNTVSNCDSYMWNNILYTRSGQFIVYYNNASGCLSADTLYLTIRNSSTSTTNISACNSYSWNGEEYTASGVYTYITTNADNCDSTATLNLTIETAPDLDPITGLTEVCRYVNTTYTNSTANGRWSSDDTTVLQIDSITGVATAVSAGVANITYTIRTALGCTNSTAIAVTVNASTLVSISGPGNVCIADSITLTGSEDGGTWSIDNASLASIESTTGILLGGVSGNVQITYTYTEPSSGCVSTGTYDVVVNALPSAPDSIIGLNELCQYVNQSDTIEYSVPLVSGITTYNWSVPVGATIVSGQNTSTIRVLFTNDLPRSGAKIYVNSVSDAGCSSVTTFLRIYKTMPYLFTLTGPNNACPLVGTETIVYYSTNISATANYYDWVVPSGATIVSGQGTHQIGVTYDTSFRSGFIRVRGLSNCGVMSGTGKYMAITRNVPTTPGFISGPSNTCAYYNNGTEVTYSIADVNFATSYIWTLPDHVTLVGGQGTNTIVVRFELGFVNSTLKVRALSNCSASLDRGINLTSNPFAVPAYVSGPTNACMYVNTGNMATYVCGKTTGAPSYIWTVPAGVTIIERPGDLPENDTIIRVLFDENFVTATKIEVQTSGCNTSLARTLTINKNIPSMPATITGTNNVCNFIGNGSTVRYSVRRVLHASQYLWTVPNNAQIQTYDGDTAINVLFNAGFTNGSIDVRTSNACGMSSSRVFGVSRIAPATPEDIEGPTNSCAYYANGTTTTYTIPAVQGATGYAWTLPSYMTLVSGQNTTSITVRFDSGFATSNIKVKSLNACTESLEKTLRVMATPYATPGTITGPTNSCIYINDGIATYTIRKVANATGYLWTVPTGATIIDHPAGTGALDTIIKVTYTPDFLFGSSIRVQSMGCGLSNARTLAITGSVSTQPGNITGTSNVCEFMISSTNPNGIIATYRIRKVITANAYAWTVPANAEIVGHPGGLGINDTAIQVKFGDEFIDGSIKVRSSNSCGSSAERSFAVSRTQPSKPGPISTTTLSVCPNRIYRYSITSMPTNATSVVWTVPTGASIVSQTSLSVTVSYPSAAITGTVKAQSFNNCSSSDFRTLNVRYNACPNSIIGTTPVVTGRVEDPKVEFAKPLSLGVSVYPNPTTSSFRVKVKAVSAEKLHIKLMDMAGRYLKLYQIMPGEDLNFGNELRAGVYMIEVTQGNLKSVERLMKF